MTLTNRLRLLGPVQIEQAGVPLQKLGSQKSLLLLAYLVSNPQEQSRARLAALLWPDEADDKARSNLRWAINNLANLLPNAVEATRHTVQLRPAPAFWVDLLDFAELCQENQPHTLAAAVELYRGDFLAGINSDDASELELWLLQERESWRQRAMTALERLIALNLQQQRTAAAQTYLARLLNLQPWHEEAHCQLMELLAATGQRAAALAQFDLCRKILAEEVAAEPAAKTLALYQQIQAGALALPRSPPAETAPLPHNLPRERTPFVGRAQEVAHLCDLIRKQKCALLTVIGEGGVGKTRLALAAAQTLLTLPTDPPFPDGIWFVPLAGIEAGNATGNTAGNDVESKLAIALAAALQMPFSASQSPQNQLLARLRGKRLLLILDNFEHLLAGAPFLSQVLDHAPHAQLLVTSRSSLALAEEWRFPLRGLALPPADGKLPVPNAEQLDALSQAESIALFRQAARRLVPDFAITPANWSAVVTICRYVRGLPLAIELATTWLAHLDCNAITAEIQQGLNFFTTSLRNIPERHRDMRAVLAYSWRLLALAEQQTTLELAIFRGGCAPQAAVAITGCGLAIITALIDKSMVQREKEGRYLLHELLRQFCHEKMAEISSTGAEYWQTLHERHSDYYLAQLQSQEAALKGYERLPVVNQLQQDLDNIRQAWRWALTQRRWQRIAESLVALALFHATTGLLREGSSALQEGAIALQADLTAHSPPDHQLCYGRLLIELANLEMLQGDYVTTLVHLDAATHLLAHLPATVAAHAQPLALRLLVRYAEVDWYKGEVETAATRLQQAVQQLDQTLESDTTPNRESYADVLCLRGLIGVRGGDYHQAIEWYDQSHLLSLRLNDAYRTGRALYCLGTAYRNQGHYERARQYLRQGLEIAHQTGDRHSEGRIRNTLGDIELYLGDFLAAQRHYRAVERFARQIGDRRSESIAHTNLGLVARELGCFAEAEQLFQQSRANAQTISFQRGEGWNLLCLSLLHQQMANYRQALIHASQAAILFDQLGDRLGQAHSATNLGRALVGLQQFVEATVALERAHQLRQALHQPHLAAELSAWVAYSSRQQGDAAKSAAYLQQTLAFVEQAKLAGMEEPIRICLLCAELVRAQDRCRADNLLVTGRMLLTSRAALLDDEQLKASYLQQVVAHRQIQATI